MTRIKRSSVRQEKELIYVTLEFFNASGEKVAELKNFTSKLVREAELIHGGRKDLPQSQEASKDTAELSQAAEGIKEVSSSAESTGTYEVAEQFVSQLIADKINKPVEQIEKQVGYYQMGLNSSGLLEVVETISDKIGENLSPTLLFEHTTIAELSAFLAQEYGEHFTSSHSIDQNERKRAAIRAIDRGTAESRKRRVPEDSARTAPLKAKRRRHCDYRHGGPVPEGKQYS